MNIEEYAPAAIPTIRGVENSLTVGTNILTAVIVISVDADVYIDLFNVSFIPLFAISVGTSLKSQSSAKSNIFNYFWCYKTFTIS